jgi:proline iminopeptidase
LAATNLDVYCAIAGKDADFLFSGDLGKLDFRRELKNLAMPLLVMAGRYDRIAIARWTVLYRQYAPQAQFVMLEKSGHYAVQRRTRRNFARPAQILVKAIARSAQWNAHDA